MILIFLPHDVTLDRLRVIGKNCLKLSVTQRQDPLLAKLVEF